MIECYTGDGKGKTTAAAGLAVRAAGSGWKVLFTQFLKDGSSGEIGVLSKVPGITCYPCKAPCGFIFRMTEEEKKKAAADCREYLDEIIKLAEENDFDMLVMDEFMAAYEYDMINREKAIEFLQHKPERLEVVITGRNAPEEIIRISDYVTELKKIRHPFDNDVPARRGIEF
jgi:cob(I)alamin adenosyltransferase